MALLPIGYTMPSPGTYHFWGEPPGRPVEITYTWKSAPDLLVPPITQLGFEGFLGSYSQNAWGFLSTNFPGQAIGYRGQCHLAGSEFDLGSSTEMPNISVELQSTGNHAGVFDCAANYVVTEYLTNPLWGAGFPAGSIGSLSQFANYTIASGLFISQELKEQRAAYEQIEEWCRMSNSEPFYSEGLLKIVPRGDQNVSGNGATYVPDITVQYNLTTDDFLPLGDEDPVEWERSSPADAYNVVEVEFVNRDNDYNVEVAQAKDDASIEEKGVRQMDPIKFHGIPTPAQGRQVAQMILQRVLYIRNLYKFALPFRYLALEPMDVVTLTDASCGLNQTPVRITSIEEDGTESEDGRLLVEAEEFPGQVSSYSAYASQTANSSVPNYNVDPGIPGVIAILETPAELWQTGSEIWIAVAGGANWGGGDIYVSIDDGASYEFLGRLSGRSTTGVTTAALPARADPDTVNALSVDLTESLSELFSTTRAAADAFFPLCYLNGEWICYETATLTAPYKYDLRYLRRGLYQSAAKAHNIGERFIRVNNRVFRYVYNPQWVGRTLYFKVAGFNIYGGGNQQLAQVPAFPYVIRGVPAGKVGNVSGLQLYGQGIETEFLGRDARFIWRQGSTMNSFNIGSEPFGAASGGSDPFFKDFKVEIWTADRSRLIRTERVIDPSYTYTFEKNFADNAGAPLRTFRIEVREEGLQNQVSDIPAVLVVSNPAPIITDFSAASLEGGLEFAFTKPDDPDWVGVKIWVDTTNGFTPSDLNLVYSGDSDSIRVPDLHPGVRDYYRFEAYDGFGGAGVSAQANAIPENVSVSYFGVHDQIGVTKLVTTIPKPAPSVNASGQMTVCPVNNHVYALLGGDAYEIDPLTNSIVRKVIAGVGTATTDIVFVPTTGYLYLLNTGTFYVVDPRDNSVVTSFSAGVGGAIRYVMYSPSDGKIWATTNTGVVRVFDPVTGNLDTSITLPHDGNQMCYCPSNNRVYVGASSFDEVYAINPQTYAVAATVTVGGGGGAGTQGGAYVASIDRVAFVSDFAARLDFINPATNLVVSNISITNGVTVIYCPQNDRLYVTNNVDNNTVMTIVPSTLAIISATIEVASYFFRGIFVPQTDRLMVGTGAGEIAVITI